MLKFGERINVMNNQNEQNNAIIINIEQPDIIQLNILAFSTYNNFSIENIEIFEDQEIDYQTINPYALIALEKSNESCSDQIKQLQLMSKQIWISRKFYKQAICQSGYQFKSIDDLVQNNLSSNLNDDSITFTK
ncbi:Hypothetical_protein [Hexamita inflata]|uniref:Hypothetical_protein n=1 Tax=Hexamita inflata TaxID=28002 RepID=A0AA86PBQ6_9EUKA|nr:Hypothetical protein HINF_LOCUS23466 [Hexamita inflata]